MLRRAFLSAMGLGPLAATLGTQGSAKGIALTGGVNQWATTFPKDAPDIAPSWHIADQLKHCRDELLGLEDKETFFAEYMTNMKLDMGYLRVQDVDADIAALKSFSDVAKVRLHMRRRAELRWEQRRNSLTARIADLLREDTK